MDQRQKHGLRGPVRHCATEHILWMPKTVCEPGGTCKPTVEVEERRFKNTLEFDRDGQVVAPDCGVASGPSP
jgi:hypothetical protein